MSVLLAQQGSTPVATAAAVEHAYEPSAQRVQPLTSAQFAQLTTEEAAAGNALYQTPASSCANLRWHWRFTASLPMRHWAGFTAADNSLHIGLQHDVVGLHGPALDWDECSGSARLLAWSVTHEPLIELLQSVFGLDFVLQSIGEQAPQQGGDDCLRVGFQIQRDDGVTVTGGQACFPAAWLTALLARADQHGTAIEPAWHSAWARLPCVIDGISLAPLELRALSVGSIVRLDNISLQHDCARVTIDAGATRMLSDASGMAVTVVAFSQRPASDSTQFSKELPLVNNDQHEPQPNGVAAEDSTQAQPQPDTRAEPDEKTGSESAELAAGEHAGMVDASAVPVALRFEAGSVTLPFSELRSIRPGYVFQLDKRLQDQLITVFANNMQVAVGELVCVGDLVGVRISAMHVENYRSH